jgi:hypothetical protein
MYEIADNNIIKKIYIVFHLCGIFTKQYYENTCYYIISDISKKIFYKYISLPYFEYPPAGNNVISNNK